jgi:hypothetical protein
MLYLLSFRHRFLVSFTGRCPICYRAKSFEISRAPIHSGLLELLPKSYPLIRLSLSPDLLSAFSRLEEIGLSTVAVLESLVPQFCFVAPDSALQPAVCALPIPRDENEEGE